jgi:hypothetical protein
VAGALDAANTLKTDLAAMKRALYETPGAPTSLINTATEIERRDDELLRQLRGDTVLRAHDENTPPSISERVTGIIESQRMSTAAPTRTQTQDFEIAQTAFAGVLQQLKQLTEVEAKKLEQALEDLGAPYTPGRSINYR